MALNRFKKLIECLDVQYDSVVDCETASQQFECLAEQAALGASIHDILPRIAAHMDQCPDCREEFEALVAIIRAENENQLP